MGLLDFFGIGTSLIELKTDQLSYSPGETVTGEVILHALKPIKIKSFYAKVVAKRPSSEPRKKGSVKKSETVFNIVKVLDNEREYTPGDYSYKFEIKIPEAVALRENPVVDALSVLAKFSPNISTRHAFAPLRWYVEAGYDVPFGLGGVKSIQIDVS